MARYRKFCEATDRQMSEAPFWGWKDNHPVVNVSWDDAVAYCEWACVRLPTEAEWEKAAQGTDGRSHLWGNEWDKRKCNNGRADFGSTSQITPVGNYPQGASPFGVLDMAGNVWEWCADWYEGDYYMTAPNRNPAGPSLGQYRALRGGLWFNYFVYICRAANRFRSAPAERRNDLGFRCVQSR